MIGIDGWLHLKSCWVTKWQKLFCCRLVPGDKTWIYHWAPLSKSEFMQWKDVGRPTFARICKSAINWLDYGNSFSGIQTDCLWQTICILERQLLVSITQKQHSSYSMSWSRNSDESCQLGVWHFHDNAPAHKSLAAQQALCNFYFLTKKSEVPSSWNLTYRRWITVDRSEGMVWKSKQKILFSGHKQLRTKVEICVDVAWEYNKKWHHVRYNMLTFYSQVTKLFDRPS